MINTDKINLVVKKVSDLTLDERQMIIKFLVEVFADSQGYSDSVYTGPGLEFCILAYFKNELVGHVGITRRVVRHKNNIYQVGGIGDVAVSKAHRKLGIGGLILQKTTEVLRENQFDLGLLFCHPDLYKFYSSCGWTEKKKGVIYATMNGVREDQMFSCLLPINLSQVNTLDWDSDDIEVGIGSW